MTRWVCLTLLILLAALQIKLWVSGGMTDVWRLEAVVNKQSSENLAQAQRNERLSAEVSDLKDGAEAIEERARAELGMVGADETFYQVVGDAKPAAIADVSERAGDVVLSEQQLAGREP